MKIKCEKLLCSVVFSLVSTYAALAADAGSLAQDIQTIKQQALELNRDLSILEEELLSPIDSQLSVFLSLEVADFFSLDTIKLSIDGIQVMQYQYEPQQLDALRRGGLQPLYRGRLKIGEHEMVAVFSGKGPKGRDFRQTNTFILDKTSGARKLELKIIDDLDLQQPEFAVKEW